MLKPSLEALQPHRGESVIIRAFEEVAFPAPYHYHPEFELTFILKGNGIRYVGSRMDRYEAGDLVLLGPHLPHCWKTIQPIPGQINAASIVIQFRWDDLGNTLLQKPEFQAIDALLKKSVSGVGFSVNSVSLVQNELLLLPQQEDALMRFLSVLSILNKLAKAGNFELLDERRMISENTIADRSRNNRAMSYIVNHFQEKITLDEAAKLANLTTPSFCRLFRKINGKTFTDVVTDYRLDHALRLITQTDKTMAEIAFESGFFDLSNFFKIFKKRLKISPLEYRKSFIAGVK